SVSVNVEDIFKNGVEFNKSSNCSYSFIIYVILLYSELLIISWVVLINLLIVFSEMFIISLIIPKFKRKISTLFVVPIASKSSFSEISAEVGVSEKGYSYI